MTTEAVRAKRDISNVLFIYDADSIEMFGHEDTGALRAVTSSGLQEDILCALVSWWRGISISNDDAATSTHLFHLFVHHFPEFSLSGFLAT